jgi:tRNA U38,U39,U40 pseudouridine synthase TruA
MYGPTKVNKSDMKTQKHEAWRSLSKEIIVPNNEKIINLLEENINLLKEEEKVTLIQFKIHAKGFMDNQIRKERIADYPQFPTNMNDILS